MNDVETSVILIKAMGTSRANEIATAVVQNFPKYESAVRFLKRTLGNLRAIYPHHVTSFFRSKNYVYTQADLQEAITFGMKNLNGMKRCKGDELSHVAAAWLQQYFVGTLAQKWDIFTADLNESLTVE